MSSLRTRSRKDPQEEKEKSGDTKAMGQSKKVVVLLRRIDKDSAPMDREIRTARRSGSSKGQGNVEVQGRESSHATRSSSRRSEGDNGAPVISTRTSSRRNEGGDDLEVTGPTRVSSRRIVREKDSDATGAKPGSKRRNDATDKEVVKTRSSSRRRESATVNAVVKTRSSSRRREDAADKAVAGIRSSSSRREEATNKAIAGTRSSSRRREEATNKAIAGTRSSSRIREEATNKSIAGPRSSSRRREETTNKAIAGTRQRSRREEPNKKASVVGSRSSSRRREGANDPKVAGTRSSSRRRETPSDPPVAGPSKLLSRGRENQKPDDNTSSTPTVQVVKTTTTRTRKVERPIAKEVVQKKSSRPRKKRNLGNGEESSQGQIRQEASSPAPSTEEPLLSANIEEVSLSQSSFGASSTPSLSTQNSAVSSQNSQEVATSEPRTASSSVSSVVTALPGIDLFPKPTDNRVVQKQKHKDLPRHLQQILSKIFNEVQEEESLMSRLYARVDKLYNCAEVYGVDFFVERYHATFVNTIWIMVTSVFKNSMPVSKFVTKIWDFIEYCFVRLGWAVEVETGDRNKQRGVLMKGPKSSKYETAAYYAVKLFTKTHGDGSQYSRLCQLKFLETLVSTAAETGNTDFIKFVADTVITAVTIRLKDKSIQCRLKAISILSYFIRLEDVDTRDVVKEIKFYTRYDPSVEIRKLGTTVLAATNMKLRFFYDQAFDKSLSVRYEALKAFVVKRDGDLVRDMGQLNSEKLCKVVIWGMDFSDTRCSDLMTKKILLAWLENSCRNNLTLFLSKLDAYEHMKAVMRILNVLLTEEIVETLDLNFINSTVDSILANDYKNVCIESMVGWLALCSIAQRVQSLAPKVIPDVTKILDVVKCLHKCALLESSVASVENRSEDITPVICLTLALQLTKFVTFEEGNRRHFVKLLQDVLLDPLLDEKPLVVQAVHTLHSYVPHDEYNDIIMSIFQDIFDPKSDNVHGNASCAQSMEDVNEDGDVGMADEIEVNRGAGFEEEEVFQNSAAEEPLPEPEEVVRQPMTKYQLTKLREQLCDLKANRLTMQLDKEKMITEKRFVDAIPLVEEIMRLQQKESDMCKEIEEQEALLRNQNARQKVVTNPPNPQRVLTPIPSASGLRVSVAPPQCADEQGESLLEDVDDEAEDEDESNNNASCIINTVEQGLVKGLCMINAHMDLKRPGSVDAFVRNIYDNHLGNFLMVLFVLFKGFNNFERFHASNNGEESSKLI
ncbi:unnamed protein product [Orchesella dallaii]|uniref:Condensin complex subunit 3 n=1 Tax=Orchesella dallaii TaxID=48710 RepID=A0ABP1QQ99_9HEXA